MYEQQKVYLEASLFARRQTHENSFWYLGHLFTYLLNGEDTEGRLAVIEALAVRGQEPPPHVHQREDELFYILEGEATCVVGDRTVAARPGTLVFMPCGVPHSFKIETETMRFLILLSPAGLEGYFKAFSEPAGSLTLPPPPEHPYDAAKIVAAGLDYGIAYAPPAV